MSPISPVVHVFATDFPKQTTIGTQQFSPIDRHVGTNRCVLPWAFLYGTTLQPAALQESLAQTLNSFPTLTGRVEPVKPTTTTGLCCLGSSSSSTTTRATWQLLLCNKGVPFSVHDSEWTLEEVTEGGFLNSRKGFTFPTKSNESLPEYMERLDPSSVLQGCAPVMSVRVTQLSGGGSILAVTAAHVVVDGRSYVRFLKAWAELYDRLTAAAVAPATYPLPPTDSTAPCDQATKAITASGSAVCHVSATAHAGSTGAVAGTFADAVAEQSSQLQDEATEDHQVANSVKARSADSHSKPVSTIAASTVASSNEKHAVPAPAAGTNPAVCNSTVDPLSSSAVPSPGWLSAMRSVRAAHIRLKAEGKHIHKSVRGMMSAGVAAAAGACAEAGAATNMAAAGATSSTVGRTKAMCKDTDGLATVLLHIPAAAVQRLKAAASVLCQSGQYISSNDAVSALVWLLMCYLRNRPMPGQDRPAHMQDSYFGVALDLRTAAVAAAAAHDLSEDTKCSIADTPNSWQQQTSLTSDHVPMHFFGNASWSISVASCNASGRPVEDESSIAHPPWQPNLTPQNLDLICSNHKFLIRSLAAGAMRIRGAVHAMRSDETFTVKMMQQVEESVTAPLSSQVSHLAGFVRKLDGFVTSWQYGIWDIRFINQDVLGFQGIVHPVPPYHAVVLPAPYNMASTAVSVPEAAAAADGMIEVVNSSKPPAVESSSSSSSSSKSAGVLVWLTVPECLVPVMTASPVMRLLLPDAHWLAGV